MALLQTLGKGQGYLKAGFLGFNKSGKTYTAAILAIGVRKHFGLEGPIAMFDTEGGSEYIAGLIQKQTGKELVGVRSRAFDDLMATTQECQTAGVSVLIAESMTHVWRELCDSYLKQVNAKVREQNERYDKKRPLKKNLEFQDWMPLKGIWSHWTDCYLNSPLHIIIAGRAGFEYDMQENEDTGKKDLVKTGIKMKTEGEFGFEPSLLVEMEREQVPDVNAPGGFFLRRRATVIGDRFSVIDGATALNPTFDFFRPHVELLRAGAHAPVDTALKTETGADDSGDTEWARERKTRTILCEEIQGELVAAYPGMSSPEKKAKTELIHSVFGTRSWTAVEGMESGKLRSGLQAIREMLEAAGKRGGAGKPAGDTSPAPTAQPPTEREPGEEG